MFRGVRDATFGDVDLRKAIAALSVKSVFIGTEALLKVREEAERLRGVGKVDTEFSKE